MWARHKPFAGEQAALPLSVHIFCRQMEFPCARHALMRPAGVENPVRCRQETGPRASHRDKAFLPLLFTLPSYLELYHYRINAQIHSTRLKSLGKRIVHVCSN